MSEFEDQLKIDKFNLDEEWVNQPSLYGFYASEVSDAQRALDKAKEKVEVIRSKLVVNINKFPQKFNFKKVTASITEAIIVSDTEYRDALDEMHERKYELSILQGAVRAFDHRKSALENIVKLHSQQYFSEPKCSDSVSAEAIKDIKQKSAKEKVKVRKRRRRTDD